MNHLFRIATPDDITEVWQILQDAIARRKADGSHQWQDGYPNLQVVKTDITANTGYVLEVEGKIAAYVAVLINDEPEYDNLEGQWLSQGDFLVFHRLAVSKDFMGRRMAREVMCQVERLAKQRNIISIKADTNFDNEPMLHLFEDLGYKYCGQVYFRGSARRAYEKLISG